MSNLIGQTFLNQFRVESFIASGGMGAVYRVMDLKRNCPLAMKVLHADLADDPTIFKRFQREAQALQKLRHPNVVSFYGLFHEKGQTFLLEEFIEGNSLQAILRERNGLPLPLPVDEVIVYMKGLCAALHYAHTNNIVHCDVKPGNVMVNHQGKIFLTDFGIARFVGATTTTTLGIAGTPSYMAPEQIVGRGISPLTDIYALGVILFEMLTGQRPFRGTEPETEAGGDTPSDRIRYAHLRLPPPNPRQINPNLSPTLAQVVLRALEKNPAARFRGAQEFFNALCYAAQRQPEQVSDETTIIGTYFELPLAPVPLNPNKPRPMPGLVQRQRNVALVFIAGALMVLFVLGAALIDYTPKPTPTPPTITPINITETKTPSSTPTMTMTLTETITLTSTETQTPPPITSAGDIDISSQDEAALAYIPSGEFRMGSPIEDARQFCQRYSTKCKIVEDEAPQHAVFLDAFWIDQYEVTNAKFEAFVAATGHRTDAEKDGKSKVWIGEGVDFIDGADWRHPTGAADNINGLENHPVVQVSWNDAAAYCNWAGRRLPTEAEWEKAARGDSNKEFPWGSEFNCQFGNYDDETRIDSYTVGNSPGCDGFPRTAPVGSFPLGISAYGIYDMSGNVWEWTADWYSKEYYSESLSINPLGPANGANKVSRGGSWFSEMKFLYIPYRDGEENYPSHRDDISGFRCAQSATP